VNWIDYFGLKPGDKFKTRDEAAIDAIDFIIGVSVQEDREYGGFLYENEDGTFSYVEAVPGERRTMDKRKFKYCLGVKAKIYTLLN